MNERKRRAQSVQKNNRSDGRRKEKSAVQSASKKKNESFVGKRTFRRGIVSKLYAAAAVVVVTMAMVWAFTAFFTVREITVTGNSRYDSESLVAASGIETGDSLVLLNRAKIKSNIMDGNIYVDSVVVKLHFPDTVELIVNDLTVAAAFEANGAYWLVSGSGVLLELSLSAPEEAIVVYGAKLMGSKPGNAFACEDDARQVILEEIFSGMRDNNLLEKITSIDMSEIYSIVMTYEDTYDIILGNAGDIAGECAKIEKVISEVRSEGKNSGCFDMRSGSIRYTPERWEGNILS